MYKYWENQKLEHEGMDSVHTQIDALSACLFLPDYLYEESFSDTGKQGMESMEEFQPGVMYNEQVMHIFPKEFASRMRMQPAFEETLMKL